MPESLTEEQIAFRRVMVLLCRKQIERIDDLWSDPNHHAWQEASKAMRERKVYAEYIAAFDPGR